MKFLYSLTLAITLSSPTAFAAGNHSSHDHAQHGHSAQQDKTVKKSQGNKKNSITLSLKSDTPLIKESKASVIVTLKDIKSGKPVTFDDLKEMHTRKLHLLIVDSSLEDYHHIHPVAGEKPGDYVFDFTPRKDGPYYVWADIVPLKTGQQEYIKAVLGKVVKEKNDTQGSIVNKTVSLVSIVEGYTVTLALEPMAKSKTGPQSFMANITVSKDGKPFDQLESVMGAFAHMVGFSEDATSILHIHPLGKEPEKETERGGPKLDFHIEPAKKGFIKIFAQFKIEGKDIFAPFGIRVD